MSLSRLSPTSAGKESEKTYHHHPLTLFFFLSFISLSLCYVIYDYNYEQIGEYLDRHLSYPMIEFIESKNLFDSAEVSRAKMELL